MTSEIIQMKWRQFCTDLESLIIPNISDDDEKHKQVQAIVMHNQHFLKIDQIHIYSLKKAVNQ